MEEPHQWCNAEQFVSLQSGFGGPICRALRQPNPEINEQAPKWPHGQILQDTTCMDESGPGGLELLLQVVPDGELLALVRKAQSFSLILVETDSHPPVRSVLPYSPQEQEDQNVLVKSVNHIFLQIPVHAATGGWSNTLKGKHYSLFPHV